jgi:hypothetical protein
MCPTTRARLFAKTAARGARSGTVPRRRPPGDQIPQQADHHSTDRARRSEVVGELSVDLKGPPIRGLPLLEYVVQLAALARRRTQLRAVAERLSRKLPVRLPRALLALRRARAS